MRLSKKIMMLSLISIITLNGCQAKKYKIEEQQISTITVSEKSYVLSSDKFETIEKSEFEEADIVYYVESDEDLAKVLEYNLTNNIEKVSYQTKQKINMDYVAEILSYIEPYDISLQLSTVDYKNQKGKLVYSSNEIEIKNLDDRFDESEIMAKQIYRNIITLDMDNDQKIQAIHDYLAKTTIYNEISESQSEKFPNVFKAAGALIDKDAVCAGYSRAFLMLAKLAKLPAIYVSSDTINHGWNLVYGNNGWRYIDITWDDPIPDIPNNAETKFLSMSIEEFIKDGSHVFDAEKQSDYYLRMAKLFFPKYEEVFE